MELSQSADDGSLIWLVQRHFQEAAEAAAEAAEILHEASGEGQDDQDEANDDDDDGDVPASYQFATEFLVGFGYPTVDEILQGYDYLDSVMIHMNLQAHQMEVDFEDVVDLAFEEQAAEHGGVVPASEAAVAALQKEAFHAEDCECGGGITSTTGCVICLEEFEDGEEVTVMPCSRGHEFHPVCIEKWLGKSNSCPLCRAKLSADIRRG